MSSWQTATAYIFFLFDIYGKLDELLWMDLFYSFSFFFLKLNPEEYISISNQNIYCKVLESGWPELVFCSIFLMVLLHQQVHLSGGTTPADCKIRANLSSWGLYDFALWHNFLPWIYQFHAAMKIYLFHVEMWWPKGFSWDTKNLPSLYFLIENIFAWHPWPHSILTGL